MDAKIAEALKTDRVIDITTTGRKSGEQRRIEIWFHNIDDTLYITGTPGTRDWYFNMVANPAITFHLKNTVQADIPATVTPITDADQKRGVLAKILTNLSRSEQLAEWVEKSPLVHVQLQLD
jgi:deazaflavin-dependent oxidoreductase (nitroreductase family)